MSIKRFECGHRGKGQYCHRCRQESIDKQKQIDRKQAQQVEREKWKDSFSMDQIDLKSIEAPRSIIEHARHIITDLSKGISPFQLGGKKLKQRKGWLRIPIGRAYRMLCRETINGYRPESLLTHEQYNIFIGK